METVEQFRQVVDRIEEQLQAMNQKLDSISSSKRKSMEWIAQVSEHVQSLDAFREEVRASFEPLLGKLQGIDEVMRIMRHATSDISRRVCDLEDAGRKAG